MEKENFLQNTLQKLKVVFRSVLCSGVINCLSSHSGLISELMNEELVVLGIQTGSNHMEFITWSFIKNSTDLNFLNKALFYTYFIYKTQKPGHTENTKMLIYKEIQRRIQEEEE